MLKFQKTSKQINSFKYGNKINIYVYNIHSMLNNI